MAGWRKEGGKMVREWKIPRLGCGETGRVEERGKGGAERVEVLMERDVTALAAE